MVSLFSPRKTALCAALIAAFTLPALPALAENAQPAEGAVALKTAASVTQHELGDGLYEMALFSGEKSLFVASAQSFKDVNGGVIYRLDPTTLAVTGTTHTDLKNFGTAVDDDGKTFYVTNSLDGGVSKVDAKSGKVLQRLMLDGKDKDGDPAGAREVLFHDGVLFIVVLG